MPTILVGTDLTERSLPAIARGVELTRASGGRLIVCHAAPRTLPVNPLFPHETGATITAATDAEQRIFETITQQVVDATDFTNFDVVVDMGEPSDVVCAQAHKYAADLVIVTADRPGVGAVARDLSASPCTVLVIGSSTGAAAAIVALESETKSIAQLIGAVSAVAVRSVSKFLVMIWADPEGRKTPLLEELARMSSDIGVPVEPWFADIADTSALARLARTPEIGLVAMAIPAPDRVVERRASPLDDGFEDATASFLIVRR